MTTESGQNQSFELNAAQARPSLLREFWDFLRDNKKWWLVPIVVLTLLLGALIALAATGAAPFIYALF